MYRIAPASTRPDPNHRLFGGGGGELTPRSRALSPAAEKTSERNRCRVSTTEAVSDDVEATRCVTDRAVT